MINKLKKVLYSVFPIFTVELRGIWNMIKESDYIKNWFLGLLAIGIFLTAVITIISFISWSIPNPSSMFLTEHGGWFFRAMFVLYSFIVLAVTRDEI
jgi:hypothetical protein